jgi:hypothetical protein
MTNNPHDMTDQEIVDALQILEAGRLQALKKEVHRSSDLVEAALNSVHDVQNDMEQAKAGALKQTRWRWIAAVGSLLAAVGFIWLSTWLDKSFWQLSAELIGGALITYVVVERGVSALAAIPAREVKELNDRVEKAIKEAEDAVTHSRNLVQWVEGLVNLGD